MYAPGKSVAVSRDRRGGLVYGGMEVEANGSGYENTGRKKDFRRQGTQKVLGCFGVEVVIIQSRRDKVDELGDMRLGEEEGVGMMERGMEKKTSEANWNVLGTTPLT